MRANISIDRLHDLIDGALASYDPVKAWTEGPNHKRPPTNSALVVERRDLVRWINNKGKVLGRDEALHLAHRMAQCKAEQRCLSGACPECAGGMQRVVVEAGAARRARLRKRDIECVAVTLVGSGAKFPVMRTVVNWGNHPGVEATRKLVSGFDEALKAWPRAIVYGAVDLTYNVDTRDREYLCGRVPAFSDHWRPHLQVIMRRQDMEQMEKALRGSFPIRRLISRPVISKLLNRKPASEAYLLKRLWEPGYEGRRETYSRYRVGKLVPETNTRQRKLRVAERLDQLIFLDRLGLNGRLVLANCEIKKTRAGLRIKRIRAVPSQANSTEAA